jgi:hypothetical protein
MKIARIEAQFPELKGNSYADGKGEASTTKAAISRAFSDLLKQPNVRRKHISTIKATITVTVKEELVVKSGS